MSATETWNDPDHCPFCGAKLASPGFGFVSHIERNPNCNTAFETWRKRVESDIAGGWSG